MSAVESWSLTFQKGTGVHIALQCFRGTKEEVTQYIMETMLSHKHIDDIVVLETGNVTQFLHNFFSGYNRSIDVSSYSNKHRSKLAYCGLQLMETIK